MYQNNPANFPLQTLKADVDVVTLFVEYLGIPFEEFRTATGPAATHPWSVKMNALAAAARSTGKPVMVQIVLTRDILVARASNQNGQLVIQPGWVTGCVDLAGAQYSWLGPAYVNYARWIARTFTPKYLVVMIEANLYYVHCGGDTPSWRALINTERSAYDAVKGVNSGILAFPSFKVEDLYNQTLTGFNQTQYNALASFKRDRLGLATYPYALRIGTAFVNPYQMPADYFVRIRARNPSEPRIVITETGWNTASLALRHEGTCYTNFLYSEPSFQAAYLHLLMYSAFVHNFDHVGWWSGRDLIPSQVMSGCFPVSEAPYRECNGDIWCASLNHWRATQNGWTAGFAELAFKTFGTMGLRQYGGAANPETMELWQRFRALPIAGN